jgi:hypothetical protein
MSNCQVPGVGISLIPLLFLSLSLYETKGTKPNEKQKSGEVEFFGILYTLVELGIIINS